jgi:diaminopimelate decarboxylase
VVRFGTTPEAVHELAGQVVDAGIEVESLSFFVGTAGQGMDAARPYQDGMEQLAKVRERLAGDGIEVPTVTIGGGFPGARRRFFLDHPDFFGRITALITEYVGADVPVVAEPGRYLAEPSTAMLTRVIADRALGGRRLVHLDSSAFAGLFETTFIGTEDAPLAIGVRSGDRGHATPVQLLGPIMDSFDVVARDVPAPPLAEGELLFLPNVGAYSVGYAARCEGMREPELVRLPAGLDDELAAACLDVAAN